MMSDDKMQLLASECSVYCVECDKEVVPEIELTEDIIKRYTAYCPYCEEQL